LTPPSQKRAGVVVQGVGPEFKPQHHKKKKFKQRPYRKHTVSGLALISTMTTMKCQA
jgi:hypothetical protein